MAGFGNQANALFRKNLTYQKRRLRSHLKAFFFPVVLFILLLILQIITKRIKRDEISARIPNEIPPLLQVPSPQFRAVRDGSIPFPDLPDASCRETGSCPATVLVTGNNITLGESLAGNMFTDSLNLNSSIDKDSMARGFFGTNYSFSNTYEDIIPFEMPIYHIQSQCTNFSTISVPVNSFDDVKDLEVLCVRGQHVWRKSYSEINDELSKGYKDGNTEGSINEIMAAYDFLDTSEKNFNIHIAYNSTYAGMDSSDVNLLRVSRSENMASNAYLQFLRGPSVEVVLESVGEMPTPGGLNRPDDVASSTISSIFFTWVILQLFPVVLSALVYEKQQNLRIMMKMHGLGDAPYWVNMYLYFFAVCLVYMFCFVLVGSLTGLIIFRLNSYAVQCVFYFIFTNLQISMAFLFAAFFRSLKAATVVAYIIVFGSGILATLVFQPLVDDPNFPRSWIIIIELYPGFSLYRGLYELSKYAEGGHKVGTFGMLWEYLSYSTNGMREVLIITATEWLVFLVVAYYLDQVISSGSGIARSPLFCLRKSPKQLLSSVQKPPQNDESAIEMENDDVAQERRKVEQLLNEKNPNYTTICYNLKKVYPGKDGNPEKFAVKGLTLALKRGECFGMLGPNGAGKTTFISMMTGLLNPSSGTAYVEGLDLRSQMGQIYQSMGICPQDSLLWGNLTGREHLLFYGRLKNLKGAALIQAVEESLKSFNLFHGGVADRLAGKYSGGMRRRLSVAIALIGDPKIVYLDEPSTGLDPASRKLLWDVVKRAKQDRSIVLTTHSMEEAEYLCDRIGIFVDGNFQCLGSPDELKVRYGGSYMFTVTTSQEDEMEVQNLVKHLSGNAKKTYQLSGTQKFEVPKNEVKISDVFQTVKLAKQRCNVLSWGLADTTLEDVFIKVATQAQPSTITAA
nr:ABC transporter A family member 7-like [Ipomoea batatas]